MRTFLKYYYRFRLGRIILVARTILLLLGCLLSTSLPAKSDKAPLTIVVSIKPIKLLMQSFIGEHAQVIQLIPDGLSPHDFQLKLSDLRKIKNSDFVIWLGPSAEPYLVKVFHQISTPRIDAFNLQGIHHLPYRNLNQWQSSSEPLQHSDDSNDHGHDHGHNHGHSHHAVHTDLHFWLNFGNNRILIDEVARYLIQRNLMPEEIVKIKRQQMQVQFDSIEQLLLSSNNGFSNNGVSKNQQDRKVLAYHDAFQYLEKELKLNNFGAVVADIEAGVGLKRLMKLKRLVEKENISCVLTTSTSNHKTLKKIFSHFSYQSANVDILAVNPKLDTFEKYWLDMIKEVTRCVEWERP